MRYGAVLTAGENTIEIFAVLGYDLFCALVKAALIYKRNKDDAAFYFGRPEFVDYLSYCFYTDIFAAVYSRRLPLAASFIMTEGMDKEFVTGILNSVLPITGVLKNIYFLH